MATTLKTILDAILDEVGFKKPLAYASSSKPADAQIVALANRATAAIREYDLNIVRKSDTITMTSATEYDLASDFHAYIPDTMYLDGQLMAVDLPTTPSEWALISSGGVTGDFLRARLYGGQLKVLNPRSGSDITYEYTSNELIQATGAGAFKTKFTADTDEWQADDDLLILETKWRFEKAKGLPTWQESQRECREYVRNLRGRDHAAKALGPAMPVDRSPKTNLWV